MATTRSRKKKMLTMDRVDIEIFLKSEYDSCMMCSGFYSNNFGQPICSTCHLFLFSNDINKDDDDQGVYTEKADSDDSGNEEPGAATDFYTKKDKGIKVVKSVSHKMDKLVERISALTLPRDSEKDMIPVGLVDSLPPEVLLVVFRHLDDISLWMAGNVCSRWWHLLDGETTQAQWQHFISLRWPLFTPKYKVKCWKAIYSKLLESSPCRYCLESMMLQLNKGGVLIGISHLLLKIEEQGLTEAPSTPPIKENSWRHRRLRSELKTLKTDPPEGIQATPLDQNCCHWQASITGPQGSPYEGGLFLLYLQIPHSYPMKPPNVRFITKIFHPNISRHGDIGLDSIHHNWSLALTISKVLISIQSLLTDPYCHVCMEPVIGKLYARDAPEFDRIARIWTWKYAMHDYLVPTDINMNGV